MRRTATRTTTAPWGATAAHTTDGVVWAYDVPCVGPTRPGCENLARVQASSVDPDTSEVRAWSVGLPGIGWVMPDVTFPTADDACRAVQNHATVKRMRDMTARYWEQQKHADRVRELQQQIDADRAALMGTVSP